MAIAAQASPHPDTAMSKEEGLSLLLFLGSIKSFPTNTSGKRNLHFAQQKICTGRGRGIQDLLRTSEDHTRMLDSEPQ